ncbi:hypothetical protein MPTK1_5g03270 [Marchantia polymorpha subsp. ruderalis]|uniref:F-box domain-containing protein n=2 Tax=Marchantia polymorpha TaxID=3197 RepID=A0AAF6BEG7_MARPO|nr:hypothetical protein MARPO_0310s0001 [Marchantia polymorpha]BBN10401.1 hypothetical protein Mp_5g03270 [Marchantia polymorpha subsp. ruderalis]|eukprot:PTQ26855.1 hypothetical protein MARPO_0310s0001 [Marchantia polymorpha]
MNKKGRRRARQISLRSAADSPRPSKIRKRNNASSNPGSKHADDEEQDEASVLDEIPDGPLEMILSRLSVVEILQGRTVCKRWKNVIDSPTFAKFHDLTNASCPEPCFMLHWIVGRHHVMRAYFPFADTWRALPASTIQPQRSGYNTRARKNLVAPPIVALRVDLSRFDRGFWCVHSKYFGPFRQTGRRRRYRTLSDIYGFKLTVHNPVSGWCTLLPAHPDPQLNSHPQCGVSVITNSRDRSFQVLCAGVYLHNYDEEAATGEPAQCPITLLFDSISNQWSRVADLPLDYLAFRGDDTKQATRADCGNISYFVVQRFHQLLLLAFDRDAGSWTVVPGCMPQQESSYMFDAITLVPSSTTRSLILAFRNGPVNSLFSGQGLFPLIFSWSLEASPDVQDWTLMDVPAPPLLNFPADYRHLLFTFRWYAKGDFMFFTCTELWGMGALIFNLVLRQWKPISIAASGLAHPFDTIPQIVPFEVQLSSVLNLSAY